MLAKTLLWDITYKCNLRCKHCYNAEKMSGKLDDELALSQYEKILNALVEKGFNHIHLLGGEPLKNKYFFEIVKLAIDRNIKVTINTNFVYQDITIIDKIVESGISQVTISLESPIKEENDAIRGKGSFDIVRKNLKYLSKKIEKDGLSIIVQIATVMTEINYNSIPLFPEFLKNYKVGYLELLSLYNCGNAKKNLKVKDAENKFRREIECIVSTINNQEIINRDLKLMIDAKPLVIDYINRHVGLNVELPFECKCVAVDNVLFMEPTGQVYMCGPSSQIGEFRKFRNNILEKDFVIEDYRKIKTRITENSSTRYNACKECQYSNICSGKCPLDDSEMGICDYILKLNNSENKKLFYNRN